MQRNTDNAAPVVCAVLSGRRNDHLVVGIIIAFAASCKTCLVVGFAAASCAGLDKWALRAAHAGETGQNGTKRGETGKEHGNQRESIRWDVRVFRRTTFTISSHGLNQ